MSLEIVLLHTLLRLSRRRGRKCAALSIDELRDALDRVGSVASARIEQADVLRALRALARQGLVQRSPLGPRLSLAGLAVAVASAAMSEKPRAKRLPGI